MIEVIPLKNLNNLNGGTKKRWIWQKGEAFYKSCDYLQKINYCIQDLNNGIDDLKNPTMKEIVYTIVLIDWICEAVDALPNLLIDGLISNFIFKKQVEIDRANKYFKAIRSFAVAHPLSTDRHQDYGFDGNRICVDIKSKTPTLTQLFTHSEDWYHLGFNGLVPNAIDIPADYVLFIYSKRKDNMQSFEFVGADYSDLYHVAELQIDMLYSLDNYLGKLRKKDWM